MKLRGLVPNWQFLHSCSCERFLNFHDRSAIQHKKADRSWDYINRFLPVVLTTISSDSEAPCTHIDIKKESTAAHSQLHTPNLQLPSADTHTESHIMIIGWSTYDYTGSLLSLYLQQCSVSSLLRKNC